MSVYRKKPVKIDAVQFGYSEYADTAMTWRCDELPEWLIEAQDDGRLGYAFASEDYWYFQVATAEGTMRGGPDDWLIRGVEGELYPCKASVFAATYELAE